MLSGLKLKYGSFKSWLGRIFLFISNPSDRISRKTYLIQIPFVIILTLIPILNIAHIIATSGENNISNDVAYWADLVDKILNGKADLPYILTRSFFYQHFILLHIASETLNAYLFGWNVFVTLFFGFFLNLIKLGLLFDLFTFQFTKNPFKWWLLPILSAVVFSNMEVTTFTGQNTATLIGMALFGTVLSIWGIARFKDHLKGVLFCILGGFISTWTFALGLVAWPISFVGMVLLGYRKAKQYLLWFAGLIFCTFPYIYFMFLKPAAIVTATGDPLSLSFQKIINLPFLLNMLGRPLVNLATFDFTRQYKITGAIGVALTVCCLLVFLLNLRNKDWSMFVPALMIIALGAAGVWLASIGRTSLASWYITVAWPFWWGILGFGFILLMQPAIHSPLSLSLFDLSKKVGAIGIFIIVTFLYARSNVGNSISSFFLITRSPASAACLRNYQIAPTYCESFLFQWPMQRPEFIFELGRPLGKNQLSANSRQQQWSLQGDFILNNTDTKRFADTQPIGWYEGFIGDRISWSGPERWHHLDLLLYSPNSVTWTVQFPDYMESAVLKSAVALRKEGADKPEADGVTFKVTMKTDSTETKTVFEKYVSQNQHKWDPFNVDLSTYKGKQVVIEFSSLPGKNNIADWVMYQYPVIDVKIARHIENEPLVKYSPENVDQFPGLKAPGAKDVVWKGTDPDTWNLANLKPVLDQPGSYIGGQDPGFQLKNPVNVCLSDYSYFYVMYALPPIYQDMDRVAQIFYQLSDGQPISEERSFKFTAIDDGKVHTYTYPIRLLDLDAGSNAKITGIRFDPAYRLDEKNARIQFVEFGILHNNHEGPSICH